MHRHLGVLASALIPVLTLTACGGGSKKSAKQPVEAKRPKVLPKKETEADREAKRLAAAHELVPEGSTCLPLAFKEPSAPRLEIAAIGTDAVVCAIDIDPTRLLGPIACWNVDLTSGALAARPTAPLPGRGISVMIQDRCARAYCLPKDAEAPTIKVVQLVWNGDGSKAGMLAGDDVHLYDAASKAHASAFTIRGDKGVVGEPTALHWLGDVLFVEAAGEAGAGVWAFKADGTPVGPLEAIGGKDGKPLSTLGGSFSLLDKTRVAVAERGFSTVTTYEAETGKRAKLVRKLKKPPCKAAELDAYWSESEGVGAKCKAHMDKNFGPLIGATAFAGSKSLVVMLRGARLGELGVLDAKSLAEKKAIKLAWCKGEGGGSDGGDGGGDDDE